MQTLEKTAARGDLKPAEREILGRSLARRRREATLTDAEAGLVEERRGARRRLLGLAVGRGFGMRTRLKAAAAAVAPGAARKALRGRDSRLGRPGY